MADVGNFLEYPPMPPCEYEYIDRHLVGNFLRRTASTIGRFMLGGLLLYRPATGLENIAAELKYSDSEVEIILAEDSLKTPKNCEAVLVFSGLGQRINHAADELSHNLKDKQMIATIKLPQTKFDIDDLAYKVEDYIAENGIKTLHIVGSSLGTPTALMVLENMQASILGGKGHTVSAARPMSVPDLGFVAEYSSPTDYNDANRGNLVKLLVTVGDKLDYSPSFVGKFFYSALDGEGDFYRFLNVADRPQWYNQVWNTIKQTFNDTSPELVWSQMHILADSDAEKDFAGVSSLFTKDTQFIYLFSSFDNTVNNTQAASKTKYASSKHGVAFILIDTNNAGHANTFASGQELARYLNSTSG